MLFVQHQTQPDMASYEQVSMSFIPRSHQSWKRDPTRSTENLKKHGKLRHKPGKTWETPASTLENIGISSSWRLTSTMASAPGSRQAAAAQAAAGQTGDPGVGGDSGAGAQSC